MTIPRLDCVGPTEVAAMLGVHPVTVNKWQRQRRIVAPDNDRLARGPLWRRSTIIRWANEAGHPIVRIDPYA